MYSESDTVNLFDTDMYNVCRHPDYIQQLCQAPVVPLCIPTLAVTPLLELLKTAKECLDNNFLSSLVMMAGGIVAYHYESILDLQDECPLIMKFSRESGTGIPVNTQLWLLSSFTSLSFTVGKSTSLRNSLCVHIHGADTAPAAIVNKAASTIPLGEFTCSHYSMLYCSKTN